ncbi:MAG: YdbH domain-containing protein [Pseudomonadales bacterium]|nr:YdbH domain-containing protein [Pseudomonadales bacterium]
MSTTLATLAAVETEDGSLEAITFDAAASLPLSGPRFDTWTRTAALTRLELRAARGGLVELPITALTLAGSGHWGDEANTLDVQVDLARIEAGVSVTNTTCALALQAEIASLDGCGAELLGGRISMPSARIDLSDGPTGYLPVALKGLDLGAILMLMQDEALDGSGTVDGALPLRFTHGVPTIEDGYVGARPPGGRLRYAADAGLTASLNQPGLDLAIAALGDFRYERLGSYVDYGADGTLGLRMRLEGASPDVENGRPINFNLSVTQNLPLLLQSLRLSQNIGDAVERRLQERSDAP